MAHLTLEQRYEISAFFKAGISLTEIGKHIFVELLFKWFAYTDNESGKIDRKNKSKR